MDNYDRYLSLRADRLILGDSAGELFSAFALHTLLGTPETEAYTEQCLRLAEQAPPPPECG